MKEADREEKCPIIDLFVVHESMAPYLRTNGFTITTVGYPQEGGIQTLIAFSKITTRQEVGQEPIISTHMNSMTPCYGTSKERLVIGEKGSELI